MDVLRRRSNVMVVLAPRSFESMLWRLRIVFAQGYFFDRKLIVLHRHLDLGALRLVHIDLASKKRASIQKQLGLVCLKIVLVLDKSCIPLFVHDLDPKHIAI